MSVVIVGGHDRMVAQYKKICKSYKCKVKVFTQMRADFNKQIGSPDVLVLFTSTVSHKMVRCALDEVDSDRTDIVRCHTISGTALTEILEEKDACYNIRMNEYSYIEAWHIRKNCEVDTWNEKKWNVVSRLNSMRIF